METFILSLLLVLVLVNLVLFILLIGTAYNLNKRRTQLNKDAGILSELMAEDDDGIFTKHTFHDNLNKSVDRLTADERRER